MKAKPASLAGAALLLVGALTASRPADAAPQLTAGNYNVTAFIASQTQLADEGNFCFPSVKNAFGPIASFSIAYSPALPTDVQLIASIPVPLIPAYPNSIPSYPQAGPNQADLLLPPLPDGYRWNGKYTENLNSANPNFTPPPAQFGGPFGGTLFITSSRSFVGTMILDDFVSQVVYDQYGDQLFADVCNVTLKFVAVYVGPLASQQ